MEKITGVTKNPYCTINGPTCCKSRYLIELEANSKPKPKLKKQINNKTTGTNNMDIESGFPRNKLATI